MLSSSVADPVIYCCADDARSATLGASGGPKTFNTAPAQRESTKPQIVHIGAVICAPRPATALQQLRTLQRFWT